MQFARFWTRTILPPVKPRNLQRFITVSSLKMSEQPAESKPTLLLDDVTGEMVSKSYDSIHNSSFYLHHANRALLRAADTPAIFSSLSPSFNSIGQF